jgi:hypothetical protein
MEDTYSLFRRSPHLKIFYFIGRLNPPHEGHISALIQMIERANAESSIPLILIGSGPKGERTMDNPVTFDTKCEFLKYIIPSSLKFAIRPLKNPMADVEQWYHNVLTHIETPSQVSFIRFAGDKGDNATKFAHMDKRFSGLHNNADSSTVALPPVMASASKEMSATIVRKTAYSALLEGGPEGGYEVFRARLGGFYKEFTGQIYREIIEVVQGISPQDIQTYIDTTKLPKKARAKTGKAKSKSKSKTSKNRANGLSSPESSPNE